MRKRSPSSWASKQQKATEGRTQRVRPFSMLRRSPAPAGRRAARQRVQAFCRRQNLAPGRIHSAPAEIKSGAPGRREPDGAELRRGDRQAAGQVIAESHRGPDTLCPALFHASAFSCARREAGRALRVHPGCMYARPFGEKFRHAAKFPLEIRQDSCAEICCLTKFSRKIPSTRATRIHPTACKRFAGGKTLRRGGFTPPRLKSNPGPPDGGSRTGPNFAEEIAKQLGK